jgi:hypothetical protein
VHLPYQQNTRTSIAQRNASWPIKDGGLGLPKDNTSLDRANAMGYTTKAYHGTGSDINEFESKKAHDKEGRTHRLGMGKNKFYFSTESETGSAWANSAPKRTGDGLKYGSGVQPNVIPVLLKITKSIPQNDFMEKVWNNPNHPYEWDKVVGKVDTEMKKNKINAIVGIHQIAMYHKNHIRSVHAAFDPMKKESGDLLA